LYQRRPSHRQPGSPRIDWPRRTPSLHRQYNRWRRDSPRTLRSWCHKQGSYRRSVCLPRRRHNDRSCRRKLGCQHGPRNRCRPRTSRTSYSSRAAGRSGIPDRSSRFLGRPARTHRPRRRQHLDL
jgi:hypothetical protein